MQKNTQKGFTLIELLVVIAIVAILSVVVILTLNPAELLRQARDSNRISDLNTLKSAVSLYLADVSSISLGTSLQCYAANSSVTGTTACTALGLSSATTGLTSSTSRSVDGNGWLPVDFTDIASGAPIGTLPIDPLGTGDGNFYYVYSPSSTASTFKLGVRIESTKFGNGGGSDVASTDGGNENTAYETGTALNL